MMDLKAHVFINHNDTLELKKDKGIRYAFSWKSKGVYTFKLKPLYTALFHSIKISGYNFYIGYDLDVWPRNPTNNVKSKNCLLWATNVVKNSDKEK